MITTKQYLVFAGYGYYPSGGWSDFQEAFDDREEAIEQAKLLRMDIYDWSHVVNLETMETI